MKRGSASRVIWLAALVGALIELALSTAGWSLGLLPLWLSVVRLVVSPPSLAWIAFADATPFSPEVLLWQLLLALANALIYGAIAGLVVLFRRGN